MANEVEQYLTAHEIAYVRYEFPWTLDDSDTARLKAEELNVPHETIYKTLVLKGDKTGVVIALVPLDSRLDYKKTAKATGNRKIGFPPMEFVLEHTGYEHGANTPIGIYMHHPEYTLVFDASVNAHEKIILSSGEIGHSVEVATKSLLALLQPVVAEIQK